MPHAAPRPHLTPLARKLAARIASQGPMSFHDYMEACLYDPDHGYYKKREALGRGGDFITAPEISQVFGELIGLWAGEVWRQMGEPGAVRLIELGPGRGTLMADALRALRVLPRFLESMTVHLIETSEPLRNAQRATLAGTVPPISWHGRLSDVPEGPSVLIANEFFDCLPVHQFVFSAATQDWRERMVTFEERTFEIVSGPVTNQVRLSPHGSVPGDGDILEFRPGVEEALSAFAARAERGPAAALLIDYGYSRPSLGDTVQAVKQHHFTGIFDAPGETDLTAHVDFSHLDARAADAGFGTFGPMPMGEWLLRVGLEARTQQLLASASEEEARGLIGQVSRLVDPAQMGALFKVVALTRGVPVPPPPFSRE